MTHHVLYFGSKSQSRRMLLEESRIPFVIVGQEADEAQCDWNLPLPQLVLSIALHKMDHVVLPDGKQDGEICFVLTADTMSHDKQGVIHAKPTSREDAITKLKAARNGSFLCTGFCIDKKIWQDGAWRTQERITQVVSSDFIFDVPESWVDIYLDSIPFLDVSGGLAVEYYGNQFLKTVSGSYSTIIGLPMFEVRQALEKVAFFDR